MYQYNKNKINSPQMKGFWRQLSVQKAPILTSCKLTCTRCKVEFFLCLTFYCLCVCPQAYLQNYTSDLSKKIWCMFTYVVQSSSNGIVICYVLPVLWMAWMPSHLHKIWKHVNVVVINSTEWHLALWANINSKQQHSFNMLFSRTTL